MRERKLRVGLAVAVLVVWTLVGYRVVTMVSRDESDGPSTSPMPMAIQPAERRPYRADVRDPFQYGASAPVIPDKKAATSQKMPWAPPPLKLTGVLINRRIRTAIIEAGDGSVFFVQEGETVQGVKLIGIGPDGVTYRYRDVRGQWVIEND